MSSCGWFFTSTWSFRNRWFGRTKGPPNMTYRTLQPAERRRMDVFKFRVSFSVVSVNQDVRDFKGQEMLNLKHDEKSRPSTNFTSMTSSFPIDCLACNSISARQNWPANLALSIKSLVRCKRELVGIPTLPSQAYVNASNSEYQQDDPAGHEKWHKTSTTGVTTVVYGLNCRFRYRASEWLRLSLE